uniref:hypothetical protein n=1 Tax=Acetatifactor sp. TaxID=1872090 RepID=UPI0040579353
MLSLSIAQCCPMTAHAASTDATHILDTALTSTGVSANYSYLSKLQNELVNILSGTAGTYEDYCLYNGLEQNEESWLQYLNSDAYYREGEIASEFWKTAFGDAEFFVWFASACLGDPVDFNDIRELLIGTSTPESNQTYRMKGERVEAVRATFDALIEEEGLGYYYIDTFGPENIKPSWFVDSESYTNFKDYIRSSDEVTYVFFYGNNSTWEDLSFTKLYLGDNTARVYLVGEVTDTTNKYLYDDSWMKLNLKSLELYRSNTLTITNNEDFIAKGEISGYQTRSTTYPGIMGYYSGSTNLWTGIFTKDGRKMIVFRNEDALKNYLGGYREVYTSVTYDYSTDNDNSVEVGGDFLNSGSYSHDIITENITNNDGNVTENIVNNVVGDTIQNITNNYYGDSGSSGSGDGSSSGSDGGSSIWDGLTSLVGGIGDILNFFVTLIGEVLSLLANLLTEIMNLVGNFRDVGGEFVYFMADFFVFIPQEVWDVILLGVTAIIGVALWKAFKN